MNKTLFVVCLVGAICALTALTIDLFIVHNYARATLNVATGAMNLFGMFHFWDEIRNNG